MACYNKLHEVDEIKGYSTSIEDHVWSSYFLAFLLSELLTLDFNFLLLFFEENKAWFFM